MKKILRIGDPHSTVANLEESKSIMNFAIKIAKEERVDRVEFMGDLFHTHAIIRMEVLDFWDKVFQDFEVNDIEVIAIVGNHDQCGAKEKESNMSSLSPFIDKYKGIVIVDKPTVVDNIGYVPYISNSDEFIKATKELYKLGAEKCLIAHQTFTGAMYENGFYAEDGIDPALVPQSTVISGHIHTSQQIGKCFYTGTPKWDTMADANQNKGIWIFEHNEEGLPISKNFISTSNVAIPIKKYIVNEGDELPKLNEKERNYVELNGKGSWITSVKNKIKGLAKIKAIPNDRKTDRKEFKEHLFSIEQYLKEVFIPIETVSKSDIDQYLKEIQ